MIVSFNFYYAKEGLSDAVLRQRLRACDVRDELRIPRGRVLVRQSGSDELPDVVWALEFENVDGHHADMAVRAASPEFEAVRAGMRKLCRRFERPLFDVRASVGEAGAEACGLVTLDWVYGEPAAEAQLEQLLRAQPASDAARCSQLLRLVTTGDDLPSWIMKREYPGLAANDSDLPDRLSGVARVEHSAWSVA